MTVLAIALAGGLGAASRYCLDWYITFRREATFPWGTFVINITGAFALGLLTGLAPFDELAGISKAAITTGFLGSYTTFSTWMYETLQSAQAGQRRVAILNAGGSLVAGAAAAGAGLFVGGLF
ncbi:MAG TPA: CrcB family protein [Tepidiformaceae bacterium]